MASNPVNSLIRRLQLSVASDGLTVTVGPGACYTPDTTNRLISDGSQTVTLVNPTINTWYHAYAYQGADGTLALEVVAVVPSAVYQGTARTKTGDQSRRYLGSMYVGSNGKIRPFRHIPAENGNRVYFDASSPAGSVPNPILSALTATTVQTITLNPILPVTSKEAICQVANLSNRYAYISRPGMADPSVTNFQIMAGPGACPVADIMLNDSQQMTVILSAAGLLGSILSVLSGSLTIYSIGYTYDR